MSEELPASIEQAERSLLELPQVECPLEHHFSDGCYLRLIRMPAGAFIIGHEHRTRHFNVVLTGKALVMMDGVTKAIEAPKIFESAPGVRKVLFIVEDMQWATLHVTEKTDLAELEKDLICKSDAFTQHQLRQDAEKLRLVVEAEKSSCPSKISG